MKPIRNEPTVEQANEDAQNWFAEIAFNAIFRDQNPDKAKQRLAMMSDQKLELLIHAAKKLTVLAEAVYMSRARKRTVRE